MAIKGMLFPGFARRAQTMGGRRNASPKAASTTSGQLSFADLVARSKRIKMRKQMGSDSPPSNKGGTLSQLLGLSKSDDEIAEEIKKSRDGTNEEEDHIEALVEMCEEAEKLKVESGLQVNANSLVIRENKSMQWSVSFTPKAKGRKSRTAWEPPVLRARSSAPSWHCA